MRLVTAGFRVLGLGEVEEKRTHAGLWGALVFNEVNRFGGLGYESPISSSMTQLLTTSVTRAVLVGKRWCISCTTAL